MKHEKASAEPLKAETKEVAVSEPRALAPLSATPGPAIVPSDIIVPKVLLMQGTSELVKQRKAQLGDIVRSTNGEKLGDPEHGVEFIPLSQPESFWVIELKVNDKFEFKRMIPRTPKNSGLEWNFFADKNGDEVLPGTAGAIPARRVQRLALYALLPGDVEADAIERKKAESGEFPDFSKALMPVLIAFRSLSFPAGKEVATFFTQVASFKRQAYEAVIELKCHLEQNDKGSFYVYDVERNKPKPVKKEHLDVVKYWAGVVSSVALKIDETQDEDAASTSARPSGQGQF